MPTFDAIQGQDFFTNDVLALDLTQKITDRTIVDNRARQKGACPIDVTLHSKNQTKVRGG
jgi:hypothetical protein